MCIGVGMYTCMYANQLVQTKTKQCKSAIILNVDVRIYLTSAPDPGELYLIIIQYILVHPKCIFSICLKVSVVSADITVYGRSSVRQRDQGSQTNGATDGWTTKKWATVNWATTATCPFVRPSVRSFATKRVRLWAYYVWNDLTDFAASWY